MANADAEHKMKSVQNGTIDGQAKKQTQVNNVIFNLDMWTYAILCMIFPASSLVICFFTGFFFRFEEVNETMCGVCSYLEMNHVIGNDKLVSQLNFCYEYEEIEKKKSATRRIALLLVI